MKPIYIKMHAFGSYKDETIDFTNLNQGIFLITGDTGSGKSTIFDAITYALYDRTSGDKKNGEMMKSQFSKENEITSVEYKFSYRNQIYTIIRSPRQDKYKKNIDDNNNEVYTKLKGKQQPQVMLYLPDGSLYKGKAKETNDRIVEIIGVDYEQFTQIAMLSQGEFIKLLQATSKERKEIFAKIFNTSIYSYIEKELELKYKEVNLLMEDNRESINKELNRIKVLEDSLYQECWQGKKGFTDIDFKEQLMLIKNIIKELKEKENLIDENINKNNKTLSSIEGNINLANENNKILDELKIEEENLKNLLDNEETIKEDKLKEEKANKANKVKPLRDSVKDKKVSLSNCISDMQNTNDMLILKNSSLNKALEKNNTNKEKLEKNEINLTHEILKIKDSLDDYDKLNAVIIKKDELEEKIKEINNILIELDNNISNKKLEKDNSIINLNKINEEFVDENILKSRLENIKYKVSILKEILEYEKTIDKNTKIIGFKEEEKKELETDYQNKYVEYEEAYKTFIENQSIILRKTLEEGKPCPVCGSIHHNISFNVDKTYKKISKEELLSLKKYLEDKKNNIGTLNQNITILINSNDNIKLQIEKNIKYLDIKSGFKESLVFYEDNVLSLNEKIKESTKNKELINTLTKNIETLGNKITYYEQQQNNKKEEYNNILIQHSIEKNKYEELSKKLEFTNKDEANNQIKKITSRLKKLKDDYNISQNDVNILNEEITSANGKLEILRKNYNTLENELTFAKEKYSDKLKEQNFVNEEEYLSSLIDEGNLNRLSNKNKKYDMDLIKSKTVVDSLKKSTKDKKYMDIFILKEKYNEVKNKNIELDKENKNIYSIIKINEASYKDIEILYKQRDELRYKYTLISNLYTTANGKMSGKHINFQTYMQRRYFKQIINCANKRLLLMSKNQFILQCKDINNLQSQGEVGLDLDVYSITNDNLRDVKTLSGGESFMAALSMALGMAEIIENSSGKVKIETMFIDEGFGMLSEEMRNQAILELNKLANGNVLIGIISHVTELKSQVETKLLITKDDKGSRANWEM